MDQYDYRYMECAPVAPCAVNMGSVLASLPCLYPTYNKPGDAGLETITSTRAVRRCL